MNSLSSLLLSSSSVLHLWPRKKSRRENGGSVSFCLLAPELVGKWFSWMLPWQCSLSTLHSTLASEFSYGKPYFTTFYPSHPRSPPEGCDSLWNISVWFPGQLRKLISCFCFSVLMSFSVAEWTNLQPELGCLKDNMSVTALPAIPVTMLLHTKAGWPLKHLSYCPLDPTQTFRAAKDPGKHLSTVWSHAELPVHIPGGETLALPAWACTGFAPYSRNAAARKAEEQDKQRAGENRKGLLVWCESSIVCWGGAWGTHIFHSCRILAISSEFVKLLRKKQ